MDKQREQTKERADEGAPTVHTFKCLTVDPNYKKTCFSSHTHSDTMLRQTISTATTVFFRKRSTEEIILMICEVLKWQQKSQNRCLKIQRNETLV